MTVLTRPSTTSSPAVPLDGRNTLRSLARDAAAARLGAVA